MGTGRYVNLQVANSGDDRFKVSRRGWSKAICHKSISEGEDRELIGRRNKKHWKVLAAFHKPKGIVKNSNAPNGVVTAVLGISAGFTGI